MVLLGRLTLCVNGTQSLPVDASLPRVWLEHMTTEPFTQALDQAAVEVLAAVSPRSLGDGL